MAPSFDSKSSPATPDSFSQPRPRPPRSPGHSAQIRAQNRRRAYLERNPSYFQSSEHELADPLLYDFLIRRFQTPAEREAEGRSKGYARVLEGSLLRGEERLAKLRAQTTDRNTVGSASRPRRRGEEEDGEEEGEEELVTAMTMSSGIRGGSGHGSSRSDSRMGNGGGGGSNHPPEEDPEPEPGTTFASLNAELTAPPKTRDEGRAQWEEFLRDRFIRGEDEEFEYLAVDEDDEFDVLERVDREEAWFEDEEPRWASTSSGDEGGGGGDMGGGGRERVLMGETGVQDF